MEQPAASRTHFEGLEAVRALAVLTVVVHHAASMSQTGVGFLETPSSVGDWGLSVFFVLSGFLIYRPFTAANEAGTRLPHTAAFLWRRFLRIFPAYWVAFFLFAWLGVNSFSGPRDFLSHVFLLHVFDPGTLLNGFTQSWSLTTELMFYLLIPLWARLMRWRRPDGLAGYRHEMFSLLALVAFSFIWRVGLYVAPWAMYAGTQRVELSAIGFAWLPSQLDLLVYGMMLATTHTAVTAGVINPTRLLQVARRTAPLWAAAAVIMATFAWGIGAPSVVDGYSLGQLQVRQIFYGAAAVAVIAPMVFRKAMSSPFERFLNSKVISSIGLVSYGVYLYHLEWMEFVAKEVFSPTPSALIPQWLLDADQPLQFGVMLAVALGVGGLSAALSWFLLEKPLLRFRGLVSRESPSPWASLSDRARTRWAYGIVATGLLAPLLGLMLYQGPPMEEGFMLAFPEQLLQGRLPHKDFLHLYGPGSLWVLAAFYKVLGVSLTVERLVGFGQHVMVVAAMYSLIAPFGRRIATMSSLTTLVILISPLGLSAMAWNGALGFAMVGLALGAKARRAPDSTRLAAFAGLAGGVALLYRPDLIVAIAAAYIPLLLSFTRGQRKWLLGAGIGTSLLYVPHMLTSGVTAAFEGMFLEPVFDLRAGRSLPIPPSFGELDGFLQRAGALRVVEWPLPMPQISSQVSIWFWLVVIASPGVAALVWWLRRTTDGGVDDRLEAIWPASLFGLALITQAMQRPDTAHLSWVSGITFAVAIPAIAVFLERRAGFLSIRRRAALAGAPIAFILIAVIPFYPLRTYSDLVAQSFGYQRFGFEIEHDGRTFYYGSESAAADAQAVVDTLDRLASDGESLIVGTQDLAKTPYSDAFFYYLFPDLIPGTRYIEMDPGIADAEDSGLADELRSADWVILSDAWSAWDEPNDSRYPGSEEPNEVVNEEFCVVVDTVTFDLLQRCDLGR